MLKKTRTGIFALFIVFAITLSFSHISFAAGIVESSNQASMVRSSDGEVYFTHTNGTPVDITEAGMTGNAWGDTIGWLTFSGTNFGVDVTCSDGTATLSGYGWGNMAGWINFGPHTASGTQQVQIDDQGQFDGYAWVQNFGWMEFNSDNCPGGDGCVITSFTCPSTSGGGGGGGSSGGSSRPSSGPVDNQAVCSLYLFDDPISQGENTALIWHGVNGVSGTLNGSPVPGNSTAVRYLSPTSTTTYYGVITDADGNTSTCSATLDVLDDGGVVTPDTTQLGCTDPVALNYDQNANVSDGSCEYAEGVLPTPLERPSFSEGDFGIGATTNPAPGVINPDPTDPDDPLNRRGCTDPTARNHDPSAVIDDGSCRYPGECRGLGCLVAPETFDGPLSEVLSDTAAAIGSSSVGQAVARVGVATGIIASLMTLATTAASFSQFALRAGSFLLGIFVPLRRRPWGIVYDSETKQPLDPAYVTVLDESGEEIKSAITDINGRYGFLLEPGAYTIRAAKTHYRFPSERLAGKKSDELYKDLYFGESFTIGEGDDIVTKNIPLDPLETDWNEVEKAKRGLSAVKFKLYALLEKLDRFLFPIGIVFSIFALVDSTNIWNWVVLGLYAFAVLLRKKGLKPKAYGMIRHDGEPLSYALIKVISTVTNVEVAHATTDVFGRYYLLVPKGSYYMSVRMKSGEEYQEIHQTDEIDAPQGVIRKNLDI